MKSTIYKIAISVILSCFILFPLSAKQLFVSPEGDDSADGSSSGNAFKTLSKAVDAAEEGDEIVLLGIIDISQEPADKIYNSDAYNKNNQGVKILDKGLTISGDPNQTRTKTGFTGNKTTTCLRLDGLNKKVTIRNLTIKEGNPTSDKGAGCFIRNANVEFDNVSFQNNQNYGKVYDDSHKFGGAIFMTATDLEKYEVTVRNCLFMGNSNKDGGCIGSQGGKLRVYNTSFVSNDCSDVSGSEGAFFGTEPQEAVDVYFRNVKVVSNYVSNRGGAIYMKHRTDKKNLKMVFENTTFNLNKANGDNGGVLFFENDRANTTDEILFVNCTMYGNYCKQKGGVFYLGKGMENSTFDVVNCTMTYNTTTGNEGNGGAVYIMNDCKKLTKRFYNCIIENNKSGDITNMVNSDFMVQYPNIEQSELEIQNSFIGHDSYDNMQKRTAEGTDFTKNNYFDYFANSGSLSGLSSYFDYYAEECFAIPLDSKISDKAMNYGNAQYLQALNINTDQVGKIRPFANGKCYAGSCEATEEELDYDIYALAVEKTEIESDQEDATVKAYYTNNGLVVESTQTIEKAEIYNLSGKLIASEKLAGQNTREEIYVNNLNPDIYIIRVVSGGKTYSQKIMIR